MPLNYEKAEVISLKSHPEWDERFVQQRIAENPALLGLGNLSLRDKERAQPHKGRLDLLLQTDDRQSWYEVEVQLGPTDESHIIRTIEYWDVERRRYPDISHTAVIIAEEITSRFFNVISLFNQTIPLVAIKISALKLGDKASLVFTTVLDYTPKGIEEEDESVQLVDRATWEKKSGPAIVSYIDTLINEVKALDISIAPNYNQGYIGIQISGKSKNFVYFRPQKHALRMFPLISSSKELDDQLETRGIDWDYDSRSRRYRIRVPQSDFASQADFLKDLVVRAYNESGYLPTLA